ncbi:hypothetical protein IG631_04390 [Alternaria alternata]|nr:hypothetical protein IG631_04390 [Alternaria alternata]
MPNLWQIVLSNIHLVLKSYGRGQFTMTVTASPRPKSIQTAENVQIFNHSCIKTGSRGHTSPRSCGRGHHPGDSYTAHRAPRGGSPQARHPHNHRNHPFRNSAVTPRSTLNVSRYDDDFPSIRVGKTISLISADFTSAN